MPLAGQPGFVSGFTVTYHILSDTPEPATLGICLLSLLMLFA